MADVNFIITQLYLQNNFTYKDGFLYRKSGKLSGTIKLNGYRSIQIQYKQYLEHRLIYLLFHGELPIFIDHIDNNRQNNRIENLRSTSRSENAYNSKIQSRNKSGVKGVSWSISRKKWLAMLSVEGKQKNIGRFDSIEDAKFAIFNARKIYHNEFARNG